MLFRLWRLWLILFGYATALFIAEVAARIWVELRWDDAEIYVLTHHRSGRARIRRADSRGNSAAAAATAPMMKRLIAASRRVVLAIAVCGCSIAPDRDAVITVDPTETYQTMKGWETSARFWEQDKARDRYDPSWRDYRDDIGHHLVNELGIDRIRLHLMSGTENPIDYWTEFETQRIGYRKAKRHRFEKINDNDDPNLAKMSGFQFSELDHQMKMLLPIKRSVEANGEKLFVNLTYIDFKGTEEKGNISHALQPDEYAELVVVTFEYLAKTYGITPDAFEVILEPDNTDGWRGAQLGAGMVAAVGRLNQAGFFPEVIAPSTAAASASLGYFDQAMAVPGAANAISTFAYHRYFEPASAVSAVLPTIAERARRFDLDTAMLEHLEGDVSELHEDLTVANVSSWAQWAIATNSRELADRGGYYYFVDLSNPNQPVVRMAKRTRELAQYFRFVRAGALRIGVTSNTDTKAVAFRNPNGRHVAIVQADQASAISVAGLPGGAYGVRYTTETETGRDLPTLHIGNGQALIAQLPGKGVITFHQQAH